MKQEFQGAPTAMQIACAWTFSLSHLKFRTAILVGILMPSVLMPLSLYGASFDCAKAATNVEKMICSSDDLSRMDSELADRYKKTLSGSNDPQVIKKTQEQWIGERNECFDISCVKNLYIKRLHKLESLALSMPTVDSIEPTKKYYFKLTKGSEIPVCNAYLKRLNITHYTSPPYCGRPEVSNEKGFVRLNRIFLSPGEVQKLIRHVRTFMLLGRQQTEDQDKATDARYKRSGVVSDIDSVPTLAMLIKRKELIVWRYEPQIDIDNDGVPDNVLVWQGYGLGGFLGECGIPDVTSHFETNGRQKQVVFVLEPKDQTRIDIQKTNAIFEHPSLDDKSSSRFNPVGYDISIFKYDKKYYFDTFVSENDYLIGSSVQQSSTPDILRVFLRSNENTMQVCEFQMSEISE